MHTIGIFLFMEKRIAIQGIKGSFHHQVAEQYFDEEEIAIQECNSFAEVVNCLKDKKVDQGVMAIENSIAGSILPNYALIDSKELHIVGEYFLDIDLYLMVLGNQSINEITEVYSHPIALLQCEVFFRDYPHIKLVECSDTAEAARRIQKGQLRGIGAISPKIAAKLYDLEIIASSIHTVESNKTRFFILKSVNDVLPKELINKASIKFELDDTPGSLATVLNVMNNCKLNLTKIQSMPVIDIPFKYSFFVDVVFEKYKHYEKAKKILEIMTTHFKVLGEYTKGVK